MGTVVLIGVPHVQTDLKALTGDIRKHQFQMMQERIAADSTFQARLASLPRRMKWLAALALGSVLNPAIMVRDADGMEREPLKVEKGPVNALFFVTQDCPVSNYLFA